MNIKESKNNNSFEVKIEKTVTDTVTIFQEDLEKLPELEEELERRKEGIRKLESRVETLKKINEYKESNDTKLE